MSIKKGDRFRTNYSNQAYQVAGRWGRDIVLAPVNTYDEDALFTQPARLRNFSRKADLSKKRGVQSKSNIRKKNY